MNNQKSLKWRESISRNRIGSGNPNYGKKLSESCRRLISEKLKGIERRPFSDIHKMRLSKAIKSRWLDGTYRNRVFSLNRVAWNKGKQWSFEVRKKLSFSHIGLNCAEKHYNWKGGITPLIRMIRNSFKYRQWRSDVFTRDEFLCSVCCQKGKELNAHHLRKFSSIIVACEVKTYKDALSCEELWNINNGITLCKSCHKFEHSNGKPH